MIIRLRINLMMSLVMSLSASIACGHRINATDRDTTLSKQVTKLKISWINYELTKMELAFAINILAVSLVALYLLVYLIWQCCRPGKFVTTYTFAHYSDSKTLGPRTAKRNTNEKGLHHLKSRNVKSHQSYSSSSHIDDGYEIFTLKLFMDMKLRDKIKEKEIESQKDPNSVPARAPSKSQIIPFQHPILHGTSLADFVSQETLRKTRNNKNNSSNKIH